MSYKIYYSCVSHVGRYRRCNQDNFICSGRFMDEKGETVTFPINGCQDCGEKAVMGIFDGMGGEECGEVAARIDAGRAAEILAVEDLLQVLEDFCRDANEKICIWAKKHGIRYMRTTAAVLVFAKKKIGFCNIGAGKIFRFAEEGLEQISMDHYYPVPNRREKRKTA